MVETETETPRCDTRSRRGLRRRRQRRRSSPSCGSLAVVLTSIACLLLLPLACRPKREYFALIGAAAAAEDDTAANANADGGGVCADGTDEVEEGVVRQCRDSQARGGSDVKPNSPARPPSASASPPKMYNPPNCRLFLAESSLGPTTGLGMYVARPVPRGGPVAPADLVVQIVDVPPAAAGMKLLLHDYLWDGQETGGQFEGRAVFSANPGVGMLANGHKTLHNVMPYRAEVDEADLPRTTSPGSGAITHYHNYTYFARRDIPAGGEILVNMGAGWFEERERSGKILPPSTADAGEQVRELAWLRENGMCLDNLRAGRSKIKDAGRGAFAARYLPQGSIVAPVPVAQIASGRDAMKIVRIKSGKGGKDEAEETRQLLTNYCYGHANSSLLLFPYSPVVNLVNHGGRKHANVKLRWSASSQHRGRDWPSTLSLSELVAKESAGLMLELVATRDIRPGDEVLIDYGERWQRAWTNHVKSWRPVPGAEQYTPSYVMDDVAGRVRTEEEQKDFPYSDNIVTACFYRYSENKAEAERMTPASSSSSRAETTAFKWKLSRGIFDHSNLRPCSVLRRDEVRVSKDQTEHLYTVLVRNRYGLPSEERVPRGATHVVNGVPRQAIRFADKLYTTDQHLPNAFRSEIGLPEGVFPERWMDLA